MIRPLRSGDRSQIVELVRATKNFSEAEVVIAKELIDICVEQPDQADYFAYVDVMASSEPSSSQEHIVGFLLLGPTPATVGTYDMYWIAVHPDYQGQGVAQRLDGFAEQFVRERNGYWLIAETSSQLSYERTRAFYIKQGYLLVSQIPDYYKPGDDLIVYGKRLN